MILDNFKVFATVMQYVFFLKIYFWVPSLVKGYPFEKCLTCTSLTPHSPPPPTLYILQLGKIMDTCIQRIDCGVQDGIGHP